MPTRPYLNHCETDEDEDGIDDSCEDAPDNKTYLYQDSDTDCLLNNTCIDLFQDPAFKEAFGDNPNQNFTYTTVEIDSNGNAYDVEMSTTVGQAIQAYILDYQIILGGVVQMDDDTTESDDAFNDIDAIDEEGNQISGKDQLEPLFASSWSALTSGSSDGSVNDSSSNNEYTNQGNLPSNTNTVYDFLVNNGFSVEAASAIIGFWWGESSLDPTTINSEGCVGIAQWCGSRATALQNKTNWQDLQTQLDFFMSEYNNRKSNLIYSNATSDNFDDKSYVVSVLDKYSGQSFGSVMNSSKDIAELLVIFMNNQQCAFSDIACAVQFYLYAWRGDAAKGRYDTAMTIYNNYTTSGGN